MSIRACNHHLYPADGDLGNQCIGTYTYNLDGTSAEMARAVWLDMSTRRSGAVASLTPSEARELAAHLIDAAESAEANAKAIGSAA